MAGSGNGIAALGDDQFVLGYHTVTCLGLDGEASCAVEGEVGFGKDHSVDVIFVDGYILAAIGQMVLCPVCQGNKYLICRQGVNGSGGGTGDVCAAEDDLYFGRQ